MLTPVWPALAADGQGWLLQAETGVDLRAFAHESVRGARQLQPSLHVAAEISRQVGPLQVVLSPFARLDSMDAQRTHADLREGYLSWRHGSWQVDAGLKRVFWGVTEFSHLVDFVNQVDLVENIDAEDRLGQPLLQFTWSGAALTVDALIMSPLRRRQFPTADGRLGVPLPVADWQVDASGGAGRIDMAVRVAGVSGQLDWAISHFHGADREPRFELRPAVPEPELISHYGLVDRTALELQWLVGSTAFKLEYVTRAGPGGRFSAAVGGFEHTLIGVAESALDLGLVVEALFDDRDAAAPAGSFEHDIALGLRVTPNDPGNTQLLAGVIVDVHSGERLVSIELERRIGHNWRAEAELRAFGPGGRRHDLAGFVDRRQRAKVAGRHDRCDHQRH